MKRKTAPKKNKKTPARSRQAPPQELVLDDVNDFKPDRIQDSLTDGMRWRLALASLLDASTLAHMIATIRDNAATHTVELTLRDSEAVVRLVAKGAD